MRSNISGMVEDYQKMYDTIKNWNEPSPPSKVIDGKVINEEGHYIYGMGWIIGDAPYFGWENDKLENEKYHYDNVSKTYSEFKIALEQALGIGKS